MSSEAGVLIGILFVGLACCNVVLMFEAGHTQNAGVKPRLIRFHRIGGYVFGVLYCLMAFAMSQRLLGEGLSTSLSTHIVVHVVLVLALAPLLLLKISIARRYRHAHFLLMPLGLAIFIVSALLVAIPTVSELLRSTDPDSAGFKVTGGLVVVLSVLLCGSAVRSTIRGPMRSSLSSRLPSTPTNHTSAAQENANNPMRLQLAGVVPETHDAKTLQFVLPEGRYLQARPGQFLTFHWIIDGRRVPRSYTISSWGLPTTRVEITPKRIENGRVSTFLHDEATAGLMVDATGPYGRFYFDETLHHSIVLIAGGVGITPMISMLRYIADRGLPTPVTLLYGVRTSKDIIFEAELRRLKECIPNFTYCVGLSQPDATWRGHRGRLTRELMLAHLTDSESPTFFLCGPHGFMDSTRHVLRSLGVDDNRINQESFGERTGNPAQSEPFATVEFVRTNTVCAFPAGSTLLDVAEDHGVVIPFGCRQGQCGTCATRVLSGAVHMSTDAGLTVEQKSAGYVLACVSRTAGNVVVQA